MLLDGDDGRVLNENAVLPLLDDPHGAAFPWHSSAALKVRDARAPPPARVETVHRTHPCAAHEHTGARHRSAQS